MEYQNYEEYMRSVLGYSSQNSNIYETYQYKANEPYHTIYDRNEYSINLSEEQAEKLYPEIYRLVNPMVCKMCNTVTEPVTQELLEKMTDEICESLGENETIVNVHIETPKETVQIEKDMARKVETKTERPMNKVEEIRSYRNSRKIENSISTKNRENAPNEKTKEERLIRRTNQGLRDLIKILILKQLLGENRPPVRPPRPPYPGGPGMNPPPRPPYPGGRPPIRPRDYEDYLKF